MRTVFKQVLRFVFIWQCLARNLNKPILILGNLHCLFHDERDKRIVKTKTDLWDSSIEGNKETKNHKNKNHRLAKLILLYGKQQMPNMSHL